MSKRPTKKDLEPFVQNKDLAANKFGVSVRTIYRWMTFHDLVESKKNMGPKLDKEKATEIRKKVSQGRCIKQVAKDYNLSLSSVYRVVNNETYKEPTKDIAQISAIYKV